SSAQYDKMSKHAEAYIQGFKNIASQIKIEGDSTSGIRGDLRGIAHKIEKTILDGGHPDKLSVYLLTFRRREKDYLLRRDSKYLDKLRVDIKKFESYLSDNGIESSKFKKLNQDYLNSFSELVESTNKIDQIKSAFRSDIHAVEKISKTMMKVHKDDLEREIVKIEENIKAINIFSLSMGILLLCLVGIGLWVFNQIVKKLGISSLTLSQALERFKHITDDVKDTSGKLSSLTTQQAAAIEETASSLTEISGMVERSSLNTSESRNLSETNAKEAQVGRETLDAVIESIDSVSSSNNMMGEAIEKNSKELELVVEVINTISEKTQVINDIVFQTKLLSFNASVEAARAGEHGRGFAVVADEVSKLANMSGKSAKEITEILENSVTQVQGLVVKNKEELNKILEINKGRVKDSKVSIERCDKTLDTILSNIHEINSQMGEISEASLEQSKGVKEISEAINSLSGANQETSAMSGKNDALSRSIASECETIDQVVFEIQTLMNGESGSELNSNVRTIQAPVKRAEKNKVQKEDELFEDVFEDHDFEDIA
ncbi:MAG: hypothetical protein KC478_09125, partial [Bacteriovoracaceae bacterium]|nr:hypothetical protein [Bacteriovoracaceae bacterium]